MAAIVLGIIEVKKIGRGQSSPKGRGMAIAGIILGAVGIVFGIIWMIVIAVGAFAGVFGEWFSYYR